LRECASVSSNVGHGSADIIRLDGGLGTGRTRFEMRHGSMHDNFSGSSLIFGSKADVFVNTSVLTSNTVANNMVVDLEGAVEIHNSTIARNTIADQQFVVFGGVADAISLHNNIIFQPEHEVFFALPGVLVDVRDLLTGNLGGLPDPATNNIQLTADPRFLDANTGNFRLRIESPAVDRSAAAGGGSPPLTDRDGANRPHVVNSTTTPYDFGAYEFGATLDIIFRSGFELALPES
jgi:hypothetical protein